MGLDSEGLSTILQLVNTGGVIAILGVFLTLFLRGEIVPRNVYDDITAKVIEEVSQKILIGIKNILNDFIAENGEIG